MENSFTTRRNESEAWEATRRKCLIKIGSCSGRIFVVCWIMRKTSQLVGKRAVIVIVFRWWAAFVTSSKYPHIISSILILCSINHGKLSQLILMDEAKLQATTNQTNDAFCLRTFLVEFWHSISVMICLQFCGTPVVIETTQSKRCFSLAEKSCDELELFFSDHLNPQQWGRLLKFSFIWTLDFNCQLHAHLRNLSRYEMKYDILDCSSAKKKIISVTRYTAMARLLPHGERKKNPFLWNIHRITDTSRSRFSFSRTIILCSVCKSKLRLWELLLLLFILWSVDIVSYLKWPTISIENNNNVDIECMNKWQFFSDGKVEKWARKSLCCLVADDSWVNGRKCQLERELDKFDEFFYVLSRG